MNTRLIKLWDIVRHDKEEESEWRVIGIKGDKLRLAYCDPFLKEERDLGSWYDNSNKYLYVVKTLYKERKLP